MRVKCRDDGWRDDRAKHQRKIAEKAVDIAVERQARSVANVMLAADRLADRLAGDVEGMATARDVADVAKALKYAIDTLTAVYGIQTPAQKHRQRMDEERLKLDKRRLEMEISRRDRESNAEPVRIMIVKPDEVDSDA